MNEQRKIADTIRVKQRKYMHCFEFELVAQLWCEAVCWRRYLQTRWAKCSAGRFDHVTLIMVFLINFHSSCSSLNQRYAAVKRINTVWSFYFALIEPYLDFSSSNRTIFPALKLLFVSQSSLDLKLYLLFKIYRDSFVPFSNGTTSGRHSNPLADRLNCLAVRSAEQRQYHSNPFKVSTFTLVAHKYYVVDYFISLDLCIDLVS